MNRLVIGSRGSALALWQASHVADRLRQAHPGLDVSVEVIRTEGDRRTDVDFGQLGGTGVFVREIEEALLSGRISVGVHSLKDLPTDQPEGLVLAAIPARHDPRDAVLTVEGRTFEDLAPGTVLGTGSPRRRSQLLHARPDLKTDLVRGNVDTRVRKLREGRFGALVLALAGVERLNITAVPCRPIPVSVCVPAVGQGALALESRADDERTRSLAAVLDDPQTARAVAAERAFLRRLGGGCLAPATAHAEVEGDRIRIEAVVGDPDGRRLLRESTEGECARGEALAESLAEGMLAAGGEEILRDARAAARVGSTLAPPES